MEQLVGQKCKKCNKLIQISINAHSCLNCGSAFHKDCVSENETCPSCNTNFADAGKQIIKLNVKRKLPEICCGCLMPTKNCYTLKSDAKGGLGIFDFCSVLIAWISAIFGAFFILFKENGLIFSDNMSASIPICKECYKNKDKIFTLLQADFINYDMIVKFNNIKYIKYLEKINYIQ